jgi:4-hydroxy-L-threonine phosphate dehydrogenase PdxA
VLFASVAHGCAFDIAGKGVADATGVIETLDLLSARPSSPMAG